MSNLFNVDSITVDGSPLAIEAQTVKLNNLSGWENEIVPSGSGPDFQKRKRVGRTITLKLQFDETQDSSTLTKIKDAQIVGRDIATGRRCLLNGCCFGKMGDIGDGAVEITFNVLKDPQWL